MSDERNETELDKKDQLVDEVATLERILFNLQDQVGTLNTQKVAHETSLTSLKFQLDQERKKLLSEVERERQVNLLNLRKSESDLRLRETNVNENERMLSDKQAWLDQQEGEVIELRKKIKGFNQERIIIDRMRREAEDMRERSLQMRNEAKSVLETYKEELAQLEKKKTDLENFEKSLKTHDDELGLKEKSLEDRIHYYEELKKYAETVKI